MCSFWRELKIEHEREASCNPSVTCKSKQATALFFKTTSPAQFPRNFITNINTTINDNHNRKRPPTSRRPPASRASNTPKTSGCSSPAPRGNTGSSSPRSWPAPGSSACPPSSSPPARRRRRRPPPPGARSAPPGRSSRRRPRRGSGRRRRRRLSRRSERRRRRGRPGCFCDLERRGWMRRIEKK